jgi:hypothetical protein
MKTGIQRVSLLSCAAAILGWLIAWPAQAVMGNCAGTGASVSISSVDWSGGVVDGDGSWSVSGGATGVRLKYSIDQSPIQEETQGGASGAWGITDNFDVAGAHTLYAEACPTVSDGMGGSTVCLGHCSTTSSGFTTRPEVSISCNQISTSIMTCTGSLQVATQWPYTCQWKEGNGNWYSVSCWENYFTCKSYTPAYAVYFKVTDSYGKESNAAIDGCHVVFY